MNGRPFLDTNVLVYAVSADDARSSRAEALIAEGGIVSVQVLNEFVNVLRRKQSRPWAEIEDSLRAFRALLDPPIPLSVDVHEAAIELARDHRFAFYDALIVAAAMQAKCKILFSEDMSDGRTIGDLTIRNPFTAEASR